MQISEGCVTPIYWETTEYQEKDDREKKQYVYHVKATNFVGSKIFPLNRMCKMKEFQEVYEDAKTKYQGREELMDRVVPPLECKWNDVVFLSPIHPNKIFSELTRIGYEPPNLEFFKIPVEMLKNNKGTVWKWLNAPLNDAIHNHQSSYCSLDGYKEMNELSYSTKKYYEENYQPSSHPKYPKLLYNYVPHILYKGKIDISDRRVSVISWKGND